MFLNTGAEAVGAEAVGVRVGGHREGREFHAPAGVRAAVGEALKLGAALGAAFVLGVAAHGGISGRLLLLQQLGGPGLDFFPAAVPVVPVGCPVGTGELLARFG